jgi:hypothetical protein
MPLDGNEKWPFFKYLSGRKKGVLSAVNSLSQKESLSYHQKHLILAGLFVAQKLTLSLSLKEAKK